MRQGLLDTNKKKTGYKTHQTSQLLVLAAGLLEAIQNTGRNPQNLFEGQSPSVELWDEK